MTERLNVMISGTREDLQDHLAKAKIAVEQFGAYALVMENMPASPNDAITASLKMVDDADIYVGIFAHRYGYKPIDPRNPDKISITEMEYRHAIKREIPCLIFLMGDDHPIFPDMFEQGGGAKKLERLKENLKQHHVVAFFGSPEDLQAKILHALKALSTPNDQKGQGDDKNEANSGEPPIHQAPSEEKELSNYETRRLEAAMPKQVRIGRDEETEVRVKISMPNSKGLKGELPAFDPSGQITQKDDVQRSLFPFLFPLNLLRPLSLHIKVTSSDFRVLPSKKSVFELPPNADSATMIFRLRPKNKKEKLARVHIALFYRRHRIAQVAVSTELVKTVQNNVWDLGFALSPITKVEPSGAIVIEPSFFLKDQSEVQAGQKPTLPKLTGPWATIFAAMIAGIFSLIGTWYAGVALLQNNHKPTAVSTPSITLTATPSMTPSGTPTAIPSPDTLFDFENCPISPEWYLNKDINDAGIEATCSNEKAYMDGSALKFFTDFKGNSPNEAGAIEYPVANSTDIPTDWSAYTALVAQLNVPITMPSTCSAQIYLIDSGLVFASGDRISLTPNEWNMIRADFDQLIDGLGNRLTLSDFDLALIRNFGVIIRCQPSQTAFSGAFYIDDIYLER
ncbi:MAG: DUF4062 domain-containing protein [Chloroflexi bacterium]|nr:DUF4062 domain-containing protein [Chloroflexota bacterium]